VRASDPGVLTYLTDRLPAAWWPAEQGPADRVYSLTRDEAAALVVSVEGSTVGRAATVDQMLDSVVIDARHFVAEFAPERVFVHAGTVGIDGRAVVIPGRSGTGKSTLVAALVRLGAIYYSDEYAVFDSRGQVHPYPKPLSLRGKDGSANTDVDLDPSMNRYRPPLPLGAILSGRFAGSTTTWQPTSESAGQGMMALVDNTVAVRRQPETTLAFLQRALQGVVVLVSPRGDAQPTAQAVMRRLEAEWA
jgi:energy-coupling factor transporter ATP-binding protein EcfA2